MQIDINDIAQHYKNVLCKSPYFNSSKPVTDINLLYPPFKNLLSQSIQEFQNSYPGVMVGIGETYRGLPLQKYYKSVGSSKTSSGTHPLGIAADTTVNKKYLNALRAIYKKNGLTILGMWDPGHVQYIPINLQAAAWSAVNNICSNDIPIKPEITDTEDSINKLRKSASIDPFLILFIFGVVVTIILKKYI